MFTTAPDTSTNRIGNLKVHSLSGYSPALRMYISNTVSSLDLHPPGMPPSAILIVRQLLDPMPGTLHADSSGNYGSGLQHKNDWRSAIRVSLKGLYDHASRPAKTWPVTEPNAVLFSDNAELLACFCRDMIAGVETRKWWWASHFGEQLHTGSSQEIVTRSFIESPCNLPPVFKQLAEWRSVIKLVKKIDAHSSRQITRALLHEFGLAGLDDQLQSAEHTNEYRTRIEHHPESDLTTGASADSDNLIKNDTCDDSDHSTSMPWMELFDNEIWEPGLSRQQLGLLGMARLLQSSPMTLRNYNFQKKLINWWSSATRVDKAEYEKNSELEKVLKNHAVLEKARQGKGNKNQQENSDDTGNIFFETTPVEDEVATEELPDTNSYLASSEKETAEYVDNTVDVETSKSKTNKKNQVENVQRDADPGIERQVTADTSGGVDFVESDSALPVQFEKSNRPEQVPVSQIDRHSLEQALLAEKNRQKEDVVEFDDDITDVEQFFSDTHIDTQLGGLLYLLNLLTQLDLPDCLLPSWKLSQQISHWALLDAVARALIGKQYFRYNNDAVWRLLSALDRRRKKTIIGKDFQGQSDYFMPHNWFQDLNDDTSPQFYWALHNNRLRIWIEQGLLVERRLVNRDNVENRVITETRKYSPEVSPSQIKNSRFALAPVDNRRQLEALAIDKELARLLSFVMPVMRRYLQDSLTLSRVTPRELLNRLLLCDAKIYVSSSHIDLVANINSSSFPIRRSGLDQDPGWLPFYGRVVLFHFSQF